MSWLDRFRQTPPPADVALIANAVPKKKKAPAPHSYFCTNNECDHALAGLTLKDAAFGCMLCSPPVAPADVSKEVRAAVEQGEPTRCPQHPLMPVVPRCPLGQVL
jgi:hypothetical protein